MSTIPFILADADTQEVLASWRMTSPATRERLIIFGAIGLVTVLVLLWAILLRKKRRRRRRERHQAPLPSSRPPGSPEAPEDERALSTPDKRRRRRRSGHKHRPLNPTLAETGGLPPIRSEGPAEPQP